MLLTTNANKVSHNTLSDTVSHTKQVDMWRSGPRTGSM